MTKTLVLFLILMAPCSNLAGIAKNLQVPSPESGSLKFDEYSRVPANDERRRLGDFATQLKAQPSTSGYIVTYGGRDSLNRDAEQRARCLKKFLVLKRGIRANRIITLNGGFREQPSVELFLGFQNGSPPVPTPTVDANQIRTRHSGKHKKRRIGCHELEGFITVLKPISIDKV